MFVSVDWAVGVVFLAIHLFQAGREEAWMVMANEPVDHPMKESVLQSQRQVLVRHVSDCLWLY
jgi:hypothetical protein